LISNWKKKKKKKKKSNLFYIINKEEGKCKGIILTAYSAGHTLGGTIWKIKKDTDEILYAVNYNHKKER